MKSHDENQTNGFIIHLILIIRIITLMSEMFINKKYHYSHLNIINSLNSIEFIL